MNTVIEARRLTKRYRSADALTDCTFSLPTSKIAALVGPNGVGKSTLVHLTMGLLSPTEGALSVLGMPPEQSSAASEYGLRA